MNNLSMSSKIFVLSGTIILAFILLLGWSYNESKKSFYQAKQTEIRHTVEGVWGIVEHFAQEAKQGRLSIVEAQALARDAVKNTRFDGDNYFWINDLEPRMVMHPTNPRLDGQKLSENKDPNGKALFLEMVEVARAGGEGFVDYQWAKPGHERPVDKVSFVKLVPEWGWIVGGGIYLDDIQATLSTLFWTQAGVVALVVLAALALTILVARSVTVPLRKTVTMIEELELGHIDQRLKLSRKDEIGQMADVMDRFAESLQTEVVDNLNRLAQGHLGITVVPRDERDGLRSSLQKLRDDLSDLVAQIQASGVQIAGGGRTGRRFEPGPVSGSHRTGEFPGRNFCLHASDDRAGSAKCGQCLSGQPTVDPDTGRSAKGPGTYAGNGGRHGRNQCIGADHFAHH